MNNPYFTKSEEEQRVIIKSSEIHDDCRFILNSDFIHHSSMIQGSSGVSGSHAILNSKNVVDSEFIICSSSIYESGWLYNCEDMSHSSFCKDCKNSSNLLFCINIENNEFMIFNTPVSKSEFQTISYLIYYLKLAEVQPGSSFYEVDTEKSYIIPPDNFMKNTLPYSENTALMEYMKTVPHFDPILAARITSGMSFLNM